jgi:hypothetical protein
LKLARLPERKPVKLTVVMMPGLYERLQDYAHAYAQAYGTEEPVGELISAMLTAFMDGDRSFAARAKRRSQSGRDVSR